MTVCIASDSLHALNEFVPHKTDEVMDLVIWSQLSIRQAHYPALKGIVRNAVRDAVRTTSEVIVIDLEARCQRLGIEPEKIAALVGAYEVLTKIEG